MINWDRDTIERLEEVMKEVQKKSFPDTTMTYNLFSLQGLQAGESHSKLLRRVETEVEFGEVGPRDNFQLTCDKLIVIIFISVFPEPLPEGYHKQIQLI